MSLILLAALQMHPTVAARTAITATIPQYRVECALIDLTGASRKVTFVQTGGRGYEDTRPNRPGFAIQRTDIEIAVLKDDTRLFAGYEFMGRTLSDQQARWDGVRKFQKDSKTIQLEAFATRDQRRIAVVVEPDWPLGRVAATGFCSINATSQQPLNAAETQRWLAR